MKLLVFFAIIIALAQASDPESQDKIANFVSRLTKFRRPAPTATSRIIGGVETAPHARAFQVALNTVVFGDEYFCSGTLISTRFVLTAAHCVLFVTNGTVILGAYNLFEDELSQIRRPFSPENYRIHEGWDLDTAANDIGTIDLSDPVTLNENIQLIGLPSYSDARNKYLGRKATISGWGLTYDEQTTMTPILREANVRVMSNIGCDLMFKLIKAYAVRKTHICTSGFTGKNVCNDDSGGPLFIGNTQIGIVSWGYIGNCEAGWPSVYTRVTSFLSWIEANSDVTISP